MATNADDNRVSIIHAAGGSGNLKLSRIAFGAAPLGGVYGRSDETPVQIVGHALDAGITLFDTSPYYGDSEEQLGAALHELRHRHPRENYLLSTKAGRYIEGFDYSPERIRRSVRESLEKLRSDRLDFVFCHDIEFVTPGEVDDGLRVLRELRSAEGKIKKVGISGYPLDVLLAAARRQNDRGTPLDVVLSYCNFTLQNARLGAYIAEFRAAGVQVIINASPMAMGLLSPNGPPHWHPAPEELKRLCREASEEAATRGEDLSEAALSFSLGLEGTDALLVGFQSRTQIDVAQKVLRLQTSVRYAAAGTSLLAKLGKWHGYTWPSGNHPG